MIRIMNACAIQRLFDNGSHGLAWRKLGILRDETHPRSLSNREIATVGFNAAGKNSKQRGFSRSVGTNQSDAITFGYRERNVLEQWRQSEFLGDSAGVYKSAAKSN
jgi:hypothetical protein